VQGIDAVESLIKSIRGFNNMSLDEKPDIIIIARGGGSTEDLMAFNDEKLAIAVYNSVIPIISAVGHETDTTIIDFVSDLRASTPTAAAEKVVPVKSELVLKISDLEKRLKFSTINKINSYKIIFDNINKLLKAPNSILKNYEEKIIYNSRNLAKAIEDKTNMVKHNLLHISKTLREPHNLVLLKKTMILNLTKNLNKLIINNVTFKKENYIKLSRLLNANSITANLNKGYSILTKKNKIIKSSKFLKTKDNVNVQLYEGTIKAKVEEIN